MELLIAALLGIIALVILLFAGRLRRRSGLPQGRVIYSDAGAWRRNEQSLYSSRYRLVGKPDYLVREGEGVVPVEVKSGVAPAQPRDGHVLQLAAYCLLVEESLATRPAYGIIQYADRQFAIDYTPELREQLVQTLDELRRGARLTHGPARSHAQPAKCATCGVRDACDQRL